MEIDGKQGTVNMTEMTTDGGSEANALKPEHRSEAVEVSEPGEIASFLYAQLPGAFKYKTHLNFFENENEQFWDLYGKAIATKNLWISVGNLFLAFAVWLVWSIVGVLILESWTESGGEYYHFSEWQEDMSPDEYKAALWLIPATAGLSGATLRLTNSFMIAPAGTVCLDALNVLNDDDDDEDDDDEQEEGTQSLKPRCCC